MMKVLAAVAALGLATPGIATAQAESLFKSELAQSCFASVMSDVNLRTWARSHPTLARRLLVADPGHCALPYQVGSVTGIGPIADGVRYAEQIRFGATVVQTVTGNNYRPLIPIKVDDIASYMDWTDVDLYELPTSYLQ